MDVFVYWFGMFVDIVGEYYCVDVVECGGE